MHSGGLFVKLSNNCLIVWMIDWLIDWPWLIGCSTDWLIAWLTGWLVTRLIDWLWDLMIPNWLVDWLVLIDWLLRWLTNRLIDWLISHTIAWLVQMGFDDPQLIGWLAGSDWFFDQSTFTSLRLMWGWRFLCVLLSIDSYGRLHFDLFLNRTSWSRSSCYQNHRAFGWFCFCFESKQLCNNF